MFTARAYIDQPSAIIAMANEFNYTTISKKGVSRAIMRTLNWLDSLVSMTTASPTLSSTPTVTAGHWVDSLIDWNKTFLFAVAIRNIHFPDSFPLVIQDLLKKGARGNTTSLDD